MPGFRPEAAFQELRDPRAPEVARKSFSPGQNAPVGQRPHYGSQTLDSRNPDGRRADLSGCLGPNPLHTKPATGHPSVRTLRAAVHRSFGTNHPR
jgi:hypothetical protein